VEAAGAETQKNGVEAYAREPGPGYEPRSRLRRLIEVTAFWGVWIGLGEALGLGHSPGEIETYLLLGVPLVVLFQLFVARRDIRELWVRGAPKILLRRVTIAIGVATAIYPLISLVKAIAVSNPASLAIAFFVIATVGTGAAGYAFGLFKRKTWRYLVLCILFATGYSVLLQVLDEAELSLTHPLVFHPDQDLSVFILSLLQYIPTVFVFEEVVFRGALDTHLHRPGDRHGVWSAVYISVLWSLWHAPLFGWDHAGALLISMVPMGVALSIYWRKSGNLGVSGSAHALADSIRNAISGLP
jgi:membrane protease YdiL (CAAX protease family)